jgi:hypothetical protein
MNAAELRARNRFDVTLASGLRVGLELPNMLDCMIAAHIPMPVIRHLNEINKLQEKQAANGGGEFDMIEHLDIEELGAMRGANKEGIRRAVKALDGEELAEPLTLDDVDSFTSSEQEELIALLNRDVPIPKAEAPAPESLPNSP